MKCPGETSIELVDGVETRLYAMVFKARDTPRLAVPDETELVDMNFTTPVLGDTLSTPFVGMALMRATTYEGTRTPDTSHGRGPVPIFETMGPYASVVHFVTKKAGFPRPDTSTVVGYHYDPNNDELNYEQHVFDMSQGTLKPMSYMEVHAGPYNRHKYPEGHERVGEMILATHLAVTASMDCVPNDPRGEGLNMSDFATTVADTVKRTIKTLVDSERATPKAGDFPNVFQDTTLKKAFEYWNRQ